MASAHLNIEMNPITAEAFAKMPVDDQETIKRLLSLRLQNLVAHANESLLDIMDEIGRNAQERGLTPEILESILRGE
jgi:hypothetical protein